MRRKKFFAPSLAFILGGLLFAVPAGAITIDDVNDDFTITWFLAQGGTDNDGSTPAPFDLQAQATFDITAISDTSVTLLITLTNQTTPPSGQNSGITSFGIGVNPNATGVTFTDTADGGFTNAELQGGQQNYPVDSNKLISVFLRKDVLAVVRGQRSLRAPRTPLRSLLPELLRGIP